MCQVMLDLWDLTKKETRTEYRTGIAYCTNWLGKARAHIIS